MLGLAVVWIIMGTLLVVALQHPDLNIRDLEPSLGRRIVLVLVLVTGYPAFALLCLVEAIADGRTFGGILEDFWEHAVVNTWNDTKDAWNGE